MKNVKILATLPLLATMALFSASTSAALMFTEIANNLRDISATGTVGPLADDTVLQNVALGFDFDFFGTTYTTLNISTNGFVTFGSSSTSGCCTGEALANGDARSPSNPIIAGMWEDLDPNGGTTGTIRYQQFANEFVVGFYDVAHFSSGNPVTFEMILGSDDSIELQYGLVSRDGGTHSVGLANAANDEGDQLYFGAEPQSLSNRGFTTGPVNQVPAPSVLFLLGAGLLGFSARRARRSV